MNEIENRSRAPEPRHSVHRQRGPDPRKRPQAQRRAEKQEVKHCERGTQARHSEDRQAAACPAVGPQRERRPESHEVQDTHRRSQPRYAEDRKRAPETGEGPGCGASSADTCSSRIAYTERNGTTDNGNRSAACGCFTSLNTPYYYKCILPNEGEKTSMIAPEYSVKPAMQRAGDLSA